MPIRLLKRATVAAMLDVSTKTIQRMLDRSEFPPPVVLPTGEERWNSAVVEGWMASLPPKSVKRNRGETSEDN